MDITTLALAKAYTDEQVIAGHTPIITAEKVGTTTTLSVDGEAVAEVTDGLVQDVTINGKSVVSDGVAVVPVGTESSIGLVRGTTTLGVYCSANGQLSITKAPKNYIDARESHYNPIVPANLDYAVYKSLTDGKAASLWDADALTSFKALTGLFPHRKLFEYTWDSSSIVSKTYIDIPTDTREYWIVSYSVTAPTANCYNGFGFKFSDGSTVCCSAYSYTNQYNYVMHMYVIDDYVMGARSRTDSSGAGITIWCKRSSNALESLTASQIVLDWYNCDGFVDGHKFIVYV